MTLFRQIYALLFGLFILVIVSVGYVQFTETQKFLTKQMESDINNASHSLGLMLVPALEAGDMVQAETLVNVIFEGGFYQQVKLVWQVDGKEQIWTNPMHIQGVPKWFTELELFTPIRIESTVTSGWLQLATLEITAHPGFGYHEMWRIMSNVVILFGTLFLITIVCARFGLSFLLAPLHGLAEHSRNMAKQQFGPDLPLPKTRELQDVVQAFNNMSSKLGKVFVSLDTEVANLREKNLIDNVSGLPNRQYMMGRLDSWLAEPGSGAVLLVKFDWLETVHSKYGYQVRDQTIRILSEMLQKELDQISPSVVARIAAFEFAFLVTDVEHEQLSRYLQCLIRTVNQELSKAGCKPNQEFSIGIAERNGEMKTSDILAQADNAQQQATLENKAFVWLESDHKQRLNREQWRASLSEAIEGQKFRFRWQSVQLCGGNKVLHREVYCQLELEDEFIHAGQFMPYIELLSLGSLLDKCLIQSVYDIGLAEKHSEPLAINLTQQSIKDVDFHDWLQEFLAGCKHTKKLCFELPEAAVHSDLESCKRLCEVVRDNGAQIGIDHFGRQLGSMGYLQQLLPDYVKLDQAFSNRVVETDTRELCHALINVAKGLDIMVVATGIQYTEELAHFTKLNINSYQGFIQPPEDINV
ncbi:EAL domain-containing protein [Parashewanella spongiae]|uniref:EAL domain-containing protein n=1 Tax=Parashewanella spongiae TaxID=342950 RepID=A0A3A6TU76_9GAMM|nr:EAL domain-containing protein [Parashewanella spongiae]MCL1078099.1 EAL domain-containing protein [Parashewanella spongiae]RJY16469.1 EAL domain-containing protein [Parashewanella spongiae]